MAEGEKFEYFEGKDGLPVGWSKMKIASGRTVYLNHIDKSTTFQHPRKKGEDEEKKHAEEPDMSENISGAHIQPVPGNDNPRDPWATSLTRGQSMRRPTVIDTPMRGSSVKSLQKNTSNTSHSAGSQGGGASAVGDINYGAQESRTLEDLFKGGPSGAPFKVKTTVETKMRRLFWKASKRLWIPSAFSIASSVVTLLVKFACAAEASKENCTAGEGYRVIQLIATSICTGDSILITFARFRPSEGYNPTSTLILKIGIPLMTLVPPLQFIAFCYMLYVLDLSRKAEAGGFMSFIIFSFGIGTLVATWALTVPLFLLWSHAGEGPAYSWARKKFPFLFPDDGRQPDEGFLDLGYMRNMLGDGVGFSGDVSDVSSNTESCSSSSSILSLDLNINVDFASDDSSGSDSEESSSEYSSDDESYGDHDVSIAGENKENEGYDERYDEKRGEDTNEEDEESEDEVSEDEEQDFSISGKSS